jgi:hypothetical protein
MDAQFESSLTETSLFKIESESRIDDAGTLVRQTTLSCPGRGAARSDAPLIRDPGSPDTITADDVKKETGIPGLHRTASRCDAPGTRERRRPPRVGDGGQARA